MEAALLHRRALVSDPDSFTWEDELSSTTGILSSSCIRELAKRLEESAAELQAPPTTWIEWGIDWLLKNPNRLADVVRPTTIAGVFGKAGANIDSNVENRDAVLAKIAQAIPLWVRGAPLREIEFVLNPKPSLKCDVGRQWALRLVPELAYLFSLVTQVYQKMREASGETEVVLPVGFTMHGRCLREGFDAVEKLALFQLQNGSIPRVAIHKWWNEISHDIPQGIDGESFADILRRVRTATRQH